MYFTSTRVPQLKGLADVLEQLTWPSVSLQLYFIFWGSFLAFSPAQKITFKHRGFPECLFLNFLKVIFFC